jgi:predicted dehydrogenase
MLDVMLWIAGPVQSIAMVGTRGGLEMEGEDTALSVIKFRSGVVGSTRHTWFSPRPSVWYTMRAFCEQAVVTLTINPQGDSGLTGLERRWQSRITVAGETTRTVLDSGEGLNFRGEVSHFLDCVDQGIEPLTGGAMARELLAVVLQGYREGHVTP